MQGAGGSFFGDVHGVRREETTVRNKAGGDV